jgi:hypothetical protein
MSPGLEPLTTESVLKILFSPDLQMYFIIQEIMLLSSTKQNSQILNIFEQFRYNKTYDVIMKLSTLEKLSIVLKQ